VPAPGRSAWPYWLTVAVAPCFGLNGGIRYYYGPGTPFLFETGTLLACMVIAVLLYLHHFRSRGLVLRDGFRWLSAILVNAAFVMNAISTNGMEVTRSLMGAMYYGALDTFAILLIWASGFGVSYALRLIARRRHTKSER
jgi:hypothetical protein